MNAAFQEMPCPTSAVGPVMVGWISRRQTYTDRDNAYIPLQSAYGVLLWEPYRIPIIYGPPRGEAD